MSQAKSLPNKKETPVLHVCNMSQEIGGIMQDVENLKKGQETLFSVLNGRDGVQQTMVRMYENIRQLANNQERQISQNEKISTTLSGLLKFQVEYEVIAKEKARTELKQEKEATKMSTGRKWLITTIIALGGLLLSLTIWVVGLKSKM